MRRWTLTLPLLAGLVAGACNSSTSHNNSSSNVTPSGAERQGVEEALLALGQSLATLPSGSRTALAARLVSAQMSPSGYLTLTALLAGGMQWIDQVTTVGNLNTTLATSGEWRAYAVDITILNISSQEPTVEVIGLVLYQPSATSNVAFAGGSTDSVDLSQNGLVVLSRSPTIIWGPPATGTEATSLQTGSSGSCGTHPSGAMNCRTDSYSSLLNANLTSALHTIGNTATGNATAILGSANILRGISFTIDCAQTPSLCGA
ncbi:MAG TPA: hypothetical protein VEI06_11790 [Gemmatimonadaceae bacterium]|nr:hypothetical protein [Gemmatimonadaceae bacterium]